MSDQETPQVEEPEKKGKGKLILILAAFVVIQAVITFLIVQKTVYSREIKDDDKVTEESAGKQEHDEPGMTYSIENLIVNPAGTDGMRFIRLSIVLETYDKEFLDSLNARTYRINDLLVRLLSSKKIDEMDTPVKRDSLKEEIKAAVNDEIGSDGISGVYITDFIIQ